MPNTIFRYEPKTAHFCIPYENGRPFLTLTREFAITDTELVNVFNKMQKSAMKKFIKKHNVPTEP